MIRTILGAVGILLGLAVAVASVGLLVWLLWWLWSRRTEDTESIEVEIELPEPEDAAGRAVAEVEKEPAPHEPPEEQEVEEVEEEEEVVVGAEAEPAEEPAAPPRPDNLKRIEGIGPKISSVLQAAGITTFAQLADTSPDQIEQILEEADPRLRRLAKPAAWPEQAALAAAGEWEALTALQKELKGGRRA